MISVSLGKGSGEGNVVVQYKVYALRSEINILLWSAQIH